MKIIDQFDAVKDGAFDDFKNLYAGNIDQIDNYTKLNLLQTTLTNSNNIDDKMKVIEYLLVVTNLLVNNGINVNAKDHFGAIPLKYAITLNKLQTDQLKELYLYLLRQGADYTHQDQFGKSCLDYAKEYSWRNGFLDIVEEFKNGNES